MRTRSEVARAASNALDFGLLGHVAHQDRTSYFWQRELLCPEAGNCLNSSFGYGWVVYYIVKTIIELTDDMKTSRKEPTSCKYHRASPKGIKWLLRWRFKGGGAVAE